MSGIKQKFASLKISNTYPFVKKADGTQPPVLDNGVFQPTPFLTFTDVLYISKFPVSLLSISQFTKHNNCKITFFLLIECFKTCRLGGRLVRGMSEEACTI